MLISARERGVNKGVRENSCVNRCHQRPLVIIDMDSRYPPKPSARGRGSSKRLHCRAIFLGSRPNKCDPSRVGRTEGEDAEEGGGGGDDDDDDDAFRGFVRVVACVILSL